MCQNHMFWDALTDLAYEIFKYRSSFCFLHLRCDDRWLLARVYESSTKIIALISSNKCLTQRDVSNCNKSTIRNSRLLILAHINLWKIHSIRYILSNSYSVHIKSIKSILFYFSNISSLNFLPSQFSNILLSQKFYSKTQSDLLMKEYNFIFSLIISL